MEGPLNIVGKMRGLEDKNVAAVDKQHSLFK